MTDTRPWTEKNIDSMLSLAAEGGGMDAVVVVTGSAVQEAFWQARLEAGRGQICGPDALVLAVEEDWPGGAGNGLGTLYALSKADAKARALYGVGLLDELGTHRAVALYHTAGKGQRLAPLPGSESNNKPAVKLPGALDIGGRLTPITVLEAAIRQTAIYAPSRRGRLSVFWGDQIFIPDLPVAYAASHHVDILCSLRGMPTRAQWAAEGMDRYGLIAVRADGEASQVEKIDYDMAERLIRSEVIGVEGGIGVSYGSFSMSSALTQALLTEFAPELRAKSGKLDTDPHFWMPLTLDARTYCATMAGKGVPETKAVAHYGRMERVKNGLPRSDGCLGLFGAVDVGRTAWWWDYGVLGGYVANNRLMLEGHAEARGLRRFLGAAARETNACGPALQLDSESVLVNCTITSGTIQRSVLVDVIADSVCAQDSVIVACGAPSIRAEGALLYNVCKRESVSAGQGEVQAGVCLPPGRFLTLHTRLDRNGREDWETCLTGNALSYAELHQQNASVDPAAAAAMAEGIRNASCPQNDG
ncbi:MAG: hypothetical protein HN742_33845 [Lentisphaerae bacterium]|jgi:hypothetical protein|nr:hypothetical protein [Lentisphaerota bacterium]MBT4822820.1 hypothetical protein [Lentisphaerota bacterium]MBT5611447.1 hypothetical protein [Lentisphaerota bacterium]MBT7059676.1 hypothetical protein [Lentisphaerota bacterium]MBT7846904.1 hypothetical protein [Lentisphaerota bacterium]